ncbi:MAG TPA: 50S ribosomal protein L6 [Bryobacteraceae bacterium]|jgi:large subunit ribosomal protein L6
MSRVGNKPIPLPKGVKLTIGDQLVVEGPKGKQTVPIPQGITLRVQENTLEVQRDGNDKAALHGLTRALAANAVQGLSTGFTRELQLFGVGYKCEVKGRIVTFNLGYSHPIEFYLPDGVDMRVDKPVNNLIPLILTGADRQLLGQVAAKMRALRPPDPYKNKGIRYAKELLRKKAGKTGASGGK